MKPPSHPFPWLRIITGLGLVASIAAIPFARGTDLVFVLIQLGAYFAILLCAFLAPAGHPAVEALRAGADRWVARLEKTIERAGPRRILVAGMLGYAVAWSCLTILRHMALNSSGFDLAIQHQVLWNLAHGRGFGSSIEVTNYLGDHVALTLPVFVPFLWIWDDVRVLLIAQSVVLALGAWPVYRLASRRLGRPLEGLLWAGVYLLTPAIGFMNKYDFHDLVLALPILLAAIDAIEAGRMKSAGVWLLLALGTREEVGLAVAGIGVWCMIARRHRRFGIVCTAAGVVWAVTALYVVIPHFRGGATSDTLARYAWLGDSPGEILKTLVTEPWHLFATHYHRVRRLVFPIQLLWPLAGFPLLEPGRLAIALPNLALSFASAAISQNSIYFQYNAPILPILFWAAIAGHRRLLAAGRSRAVLLILLLFSLTAANLADPAALKRVGRPYTIVEGTTPRPNRAAFARAERMIPRDASLLASNDLAPHFSARTMLWVFHTRRANPPAEWAIIDLVDRRHLESEQEVAQVVTHLLRDAKYAPLFFEDGIVVLRREVAADPAAAVSLERYLAGATGLGPTPDPGR
jgi:uncharacterized membrane protein